MAFAIFLNGADIATLATKVQSAGISGKDRNDGRAFWDGGLSSWAAAPRAPIEHPRYDNDPDLRILVVTGVTLDSFRQYLYFLSGKYPAIVDYLRKLADTCADHWGAVEPWPFTTGQDPWAGFPRLPAPLPQPPPPPPPRP